MQSDMVFFWTPAVVAGIGRKRMEGSPVCVFGLFLVWLFPPRSGSAKNLLAIKRPLVHRIQRRVVSFS